MAKGVYSAVLAFGLASSVAAQDAIVWAEDVQGWRVAIDRTIDNSCFIISSFGNDQYLRLQLNSEQRNLQLIVASLAWESLQSGKHYDIKLSFDDEQSWSGQAKGHRWKNILPSLVMSMPFEDSDTPGFMKEFGSTGSVRVIYDGSEIANLAMTGAGKAVEAMLECQAQMLSADKTNEKGTDPFAVTAGQT